MSSVQMMPPAAAVATDGAAAYDANAAATVNAAAAAAALPRSRSRSPSPSRRPLLPHQQVTSSPAQPQMDTANSDAAQSTTATVAAATADSDSAAAAASTIPSAVDESAAASASAASAPPTARALRPISAQASRRSSTTRHPSEVRIQQRTVAEKPKQRPSADKTNTQLARCGAAAAVGSVRAVQSLTLQYGSVPVVLPFDFFLSRLVGCFIPTVAPTAGGCWCACASSSRMCGAFRFV